MQTRIYRSTKDREAYTLQVDGFDSGESFSVCCDYKNTVPALEAIHDIDQRVRVYLERRAEARLSSAAGSLINSYGRKE